MIGDLLINTGNIRYSYNSNNIEIIKEDNIDFTNTKIYIVPNTERLLIRAFYISSITIEEGEKIVFDSDVKVNLSIVENLLEINIKIDEIVKFISNDNAVERKIISRNVFNENVKALGSKIASYEIKSKSKSYKIINNKIYIEIKFILEIIYENRKKDDEQVEIISNKLIDTLRYKVKNKLKGKNRLEAIKTVVDISKSKSVDELIILNIEVKYKIRFYTYSIQKFIKNNSIVLEESKNYKKVYSKDSYKELEVKDVNSNYDIDENKDLNIITEIEYIEIK